MGGLRVIGDADVLVAAGDAGLGHRLQRVDAVRGDGMRVQHAAQVLGGHKWRDRMGLRARGVAFLNDIHGFPHATMYPALAASSCRLIAMHSLHGPNHITRADIPVPDVVDTIIRFFEDRLAVLERAGIARQRMIVDPGMGFFWLQSDGIVRRTRRHRPHE
ncbi:MAG TPA: dihydropteroate synthase, partial [Trinickia sp.]|nr:dihydropteroate synthase [Trinickia sp.]